MQIVIDIPQDVYDVVGQGHMSGVDKAILNGVVLPEHHGRLIDADECVRVYCDKYCEEGFDECHVGQSCTLVKSLVKAPTVLEGVKE